MITLVKDMERTPCPDCGVDVGNVHLKGCDTERCTQCKGQSLSCNCDTKEREAWSGIAYEEVMLLCEEEDMYCKFAPGEGWVKVSKEDPDATHDLNTAIMMLMKNMV